MGVMTWTEQVETQDAEQTHPQLVRAGWPGHLIKAAFDFYQYRLRLRTGEVIDFSYARPGASLEWARLDGVSMVEDDHTLDYFTERGVDVRVADIVWVGDASS